MPQILTFIGVEFFLPHPHLIKEVASAKGDVHQGDVIRVPRGGAGEFAGISKIETQERNSLALGRLDPHLGPQGHTASLQLFSNNMDLDTFLVVHQ